MTSMLESVITEGTGYPNAVLDRPAAGKTGTTSDFHDAWFVGYTADDLVAAVWVGNDDNHPMEESYGGNVPAKTWAYFMKHALVHTPKRDFPIPAGDVRIMTLCSTGRQEVFVNGTEPQNDDCTPRHPKKDRLAGVSPSPTAPDATEATPEVIDGTTTEAVPTIPSSDATQPSTAAATPIPGDPNDPVVP
jgi:penicillin-binding protein 1A